MAIHAMRIRVPMPKYTDAEVLMEFSIIVLSNSTIESATRSPSRRLNASVLSQLLSLALFVAAFSIVP